MGYTDIIFDNLSSLVQEMCDYMGEDSQALTNRESFLRIVALQLQLISEEEYIDKIDFSDVDWRQKAKEFIQREIDEWKNDVP
jgi:hypothetical protein